MLLKNYMYLRGRICVKYMIGHLLNSVTLKTDLFFLIKLNQNLMSNVAKRRVIKDLQRVQTDALPGVSVAPFPQNMMLHHAIIQGPRDSEFEGGVFHLLIRFPSDYPLKPPDVRFLSKIFHPNIYPDGRICLDILNREWSTGYNLSGILTSIQSLLSDPNEASPACLEASILYKTNYSEYVRRVLKSVEESWNIPSVPTKWLEN